MPSLATFSLPIPSDDKEFELMVRDYCNNFYGTSELYGRNGQKQNGVDIIHYDTGTIVGIQCKDYQNTIITQTTVDEMIMLAESFQPPLNYFVIATTAVKDARLQSYTYTISKERTEKGKFQVCLVYWDEISNFIKNNNSLLQKYYGGLINMFSTTENNTQPITTAKELKSEFSKCIAQYGVFDFMNVDPEIGMPGNLPIEVDCFVMAVDSLLQHAFMCQTKKCYQHIAHFKNALASYSYFLATILFPTNSGAYTIQSPYTLQNIEHVRNEIKKQRLFIDSIFGEIYKDRSFFK